MASDHDAANPASADLCDQLFDLLAQRVGELQRSQVGRWCCFFPQSGNRFAFVTHRKRMRRLEVWFSGGDGLQERFPQLNIRQRTPTVGGWQGFDSRFYVDDLPQLQTAVDLLTFASTTAVINVEDQDLTDDEIDGALRANRLRIGMVPTDSKQALARRRHGQDRIHKLTVENYEARCAVCDVTDPALLIASHIVGWADAPEHRGNLANVMCLCRMHDALFEVGYWSLEDSLALLKKESVQSKTIRDLLDRMTFFKLPLAHPPTPCFVRRHRERFGFGT
jgi:hypothetical protein